MNKQQSFFLLVLFLMNSYLSAELPVVQDLLAQTPKIELLRFSLDRVQAEQLKFLAKQKRISRLRKVLVASAVVASAGLLYWYVKPVQEVAKVMTDAEKADIKFKAECAFLDHRYPDFWLRCKYIFADALIIPIIYGVVNVFISSDSKGFLSKLMGFLGSIDKDARISYEWFCHAVNNFIVVAQKTGIQGLSQVQAESYQRAAVCAHNSLILYSESFIAAILFQLQCVKQQHQAFKQEVVQTVQTMILALESLWQNDSLQLSQEALHHILVTQEILCAQQKRIYLYV